MEVGCPFCGQKVTVEKDTGEAECPSCRAIFEVGAINRRPGDLEAQPRKVTEAWLREDTAEKEGPKAPEAQGRRSTSAYLREREGEGEAREPGIYRLRHEDLVYPEDEVYVRPTVRLTTEKPEQPAPGLPEEEISRAKPAPPSSKSIPIFEDERPASRRRLTTQEREKEPAPPFWDEFPFTEEAKTDRPVRPAEAKPSIGRVSWMSSGPGYDAETKPETIESAQGQGLSVEDLSFEDLSRFEMEPGSLDLESALREESEPEAPLGWKEDVFPKESKETGAPQQEASSLGLPDEWLDLEERQVEEPSLEDLEDFEPSLASEGVGEARIAPEVGPVPQVQATQPPVRVSPAITPARQVPRRRLAGALLRLSLVAVLVLILVGILLGQTDYGYFGINLFAPEDSSVATGRRFAPHPGDAEGIARDTPKAYRAEIARLENVLREQADNEGARADMLELLMRFRERFPSAVKADERLERRLKDLQQTVTLSGPKAAIVRGLELMHQGRYQDARAALETTSPTPMQDADTLYFFGKIALGLGRLEEAERYFELAVVKNPAVLSAKYYLAKIKWEKGEVNEATRILEDILQVEPEHMSAKVLLAEVTFATKDYEKAGAIAQEVLTRADAQAYSDELFEAHLLLAKVAEAVGRSEERVAELRAALGLKPTHEETAIALGRIYHQAEKFEEALEVLTPCWQGGCESLEFLTLYEEALLAAAQEVKAQEVIAKGKEKHPGSADFAIIYGRYLMGVGHTRAAIEAFDEATKTAPSVTEGYLLLADALYKEGKIGQAIRRLEEGLSKVNDTARLLKKMALLYREIRDFSKAEEALRKVLSLVAGDLEAQESLGLTVLAIGRPEEAVALLGALYARQALTQEGILGLAKGYLMLGKAVKACEVLAKAYRKKEEDPVLATEYAYALNEAGRVKEAEEVIRKLLANNPSHAKAYYVLGLVHASQGDRKGAIDSFVRAVQMDPRDTRYRLELARALASQGSEDSLREALNHLTHVIAVYEREDLRRQERQADAYVLRGTIYFSQQKYPLALKDFEAALAIEPSRLDILVNYGRTLYELGRFEEARPYFKQVLTKDSNHPDANYFYGRILLRDGNIEAAREKLEKVAQLAPERFPEALRLLGFIYKDKDLKPLARKAFTSYLKYADKNSAEAREVSRALETLR